VESTQDKTTKQNKTNLQARDSSARRDRHLLRSPTLPDRPKPTDLSRQLLASSPAPCASSAHHPNSLAAPFILSACARRLHALHPRRRCSCDDAASSLASPSHHPSPSSPRSRRLALPCLALLHTSTSGRRNPRCSRPRPHSAYRHPTRPRLWRPAVHRLRKPSLAGPNLLCQTRAKSSSPKGTMLSGGSS